jgi:hypothetical protein
MDSSDNNWSEIPKDERHWELGTIYNYLCDHEVQLLKFPNKDAQNRLSSWTLPLNQNHNGLIQSIRVPLSSPVFSGLTKSQSRTYVICTHSFTLWTDFLKVKIEGRKFCNSGHHIQLPSWQPVWLGPLALGWMGLEHVAYLGVQWMSWNKNYDIIRTSRKNGMRNEE